MKIRAFAIPLLAGVILIWAAGSLLAHHAFASQYDANRIVRQHGVIMLFAQLNPHSLIFVDSKDANGQIEHWALEGSNTDGMTRLNLDRNTLQPGDAIEFCGYATKEGVEPLKSYQRPEPITLSLKSIPRPIFTGKLVSPALIVLASGRRVEWRSESPCLESK